MRDAAACQICADLVLSRPVKRDMLEATNISCSNRRQLALERINLHYKSRVDFLVGTHLVLC